MLLRAIHEYKNRIINSNLLHFEQKSTNINTKQASVTEKKKEKSVVVLCIPLHIVCKELAP